MQVATISTPLPYLFPFSVPCTVVHPCTGDQIIYDKNFFQICIQLAASSTHLEMERTGPQWKTSPPSSLQWTPALPSTRRPPYPSSRAQSEFWGFLVKIITKDLSFPILTLYFLRLRPDQREQLVSKSKWFTQFTMKVGQFSYFVN